MGEGSGVSKRCLAIEAEGVVSLFENSRAREPALGFRKSKTHRVLEDSERGRSFRQQAEGGGVLAFKRVRWIQEDDARGVNAKTQERGASDHGGARFKFERRQILTDGEKGGAVFLQEPGVACAAAEGFDSDRTGSGVSVEKSRALKVRSQDVE